MYIDKLDDIANKYNNTHHSAIKMKPAYVKQSTYIGLIVRLSKHKKIFAKDFVANSSE